MSLKMRHSLAAFSLFLVACAEPPRIDNGSTEACSASLQVVAKAAEADGDSSAFAGAMATVAGRAKFGTLPGALGSPTTQLDDLRGVMPPDVDSTAELGAICAALSGLSADEIVEQADTLAGDVASRLEVIRARAYLEKLRAVKRRAAMQRDSLQQFVVESARLSQKFTFEGLQSMIHLKVRNGTAHPISKAYFHAHAAVPGRTMAWLDQDFDYEIPGGLEPGEEATWVIRPKRFRSNWPDVKVPDDAKFSVEVVRIDDPTRFWLWQARFTSSDQYMLDSLAARFAEEQSSTGG